MAETPIRNITLREAEDYSVQGAVTDAAGSAVDISGWTLKADIKKKDSDKVKAGSFAFSFLTDGTDGIYIRTITAVNISALSLRSGVFDQFYVEGGIPTKMFKGDITVEKNRTETS